MKVSELIKLLEKQPQGAVVGRVGHFGEMYAIDEDDITLTKCYVTPDGWRNNCRRENIEIVQISMPDIGPYPD